MANLFTVTRPYAKAILELARQDNSYAKWTDMLKYLADVVADPKALAFIKNLSISTDDKADFLCSIAPDMLDDQGKNLVKVLAHYKRLLIIPVLYKMYEAFRKEAQQEVTLRVVTAKEFNEAALLDLQKLIKAKFKGPVNLEQEVDSSLVGGGKIKFGDRVLDASIKGNLMALYRHLTQ